MDIVTMPLPYQIQDGQLADAVPVMGNFNYIANSVNASISPTPLAFTPTMTISGLSLGVTYAVQTGIYFAIGGLVYAWGEIILATKGPTNGAIAIDLPVPANVALGAQAPVGTLTLQSGAAFAFDWANLATSSGTSFLVIVSRANSPTTFLSDADITDSSRFLFNAIYPS